MAHSVTWIIGEIGRTFREGVRAFSVSPDTWQALYEHYRHHVGVSVSERDGLAILIVPLLGGWFTVGADGNLGADQLRWLAHGD